jgi:hypothetical protein
MPLGICNPHAMDARPDSSPCLLANWSAAYSRRYNFCPIPESGEDAVLFASLALVLACLLSGRLSALWVFIAGNLCCVSITDYGFACQTLGCKQLSPEDVGCRDMEVSSVTAGGALQLFNSVCNMGPLSNAFAIWLSISPADLFLYIFLPPLLLDSAVRMEWFVFRKVSMQPHGAHATAV